MELLHWKQESPVTRKFTISGENGPVGNLAFRGWTSHDADFNSERIQLHFKKQNWLEQDVVIYFKGEMIGVSKTFGFGITRTTLVSGEQFTLQGNSLNSSTDLVDEVGNTLVRFEQDNSIVTGGSIAIGSDIPELTKLLLVSVGLYFKHMR